jgi:hypothetical protein
VNKIKVILPLEAISADNYKTIVSKHEVIDESERQLVLRVDASEAENLVTRYNGYMDVSEAR